MREEEGGQYPLLCPDTAANYLLRDCISKSRHRRSSLAATVARVARSYGTIEGSPSYHSLDVPSFEVSVYSTSC